MSNSNENMPAGEISTMPYGEQVRVLHEFESGGYPASVSLIGMHATAATFMAHARRAVASELNVCEGDDWQLDGGAPSYEWWAAMWWNEAGDEVIGDIRTATHDDHDGMWCWHELTTDEAARYPFALPVTTINVRDARHDRKATA